MDQRGRKSAASLTVIPSGELETFQRPEPPGHLTDEMAEIWIKMVNALPADYFKEETHETLVRYCRMVVQTRRIAQAIEDLRDNGGDGWIDDYDKLLRMLDREERRLLAHERSMRATHQSQYHPEKKRSGGANIKKPF